MDKQSSFERILTAAEMSRFDRETIEYVGVPSLVLMERAALAVVDAMEQAEYDLSDVLVLCGSGNNGGDGFAIARILRERGYHSHIFYHGKPDFSTMTKDTRAQKEICDNYQIPVESDINKCTEYVTAVVDALFGIGLNRPLDEKTCGIVNFVNKELRPEGVRVISVDIPSGIAADTGKVMGAAIRADLTVTFAYRKLGHVLYPGTKYAGRVICADIGIAKHIAGRIRPECMVLTDAVLPAVKRKPDSHKGTYGKALIIAGSEGIGGCALLAAKACFMTGAGMVRVFTHRANRDMILGHLPEAMVDTYSDDKEKDGGSSFDKARFLAALAWADVIGIGPGIGFSEAAKEMLSLVLTECTKPLLADADAIALLKDHEDYLTGNETRDIIITPHIGELARFLEVDRSIVIDDFVHVAKNVAERFHLVCVLKDARTVITKPDFGYRLNLTGNNGMASAGMGDTLFGIILGLLAQGTGAFHAAALGAYIHGYAADRAIEETGKSGLLASDVIKYLKYCLE